MFSRKGHWRPIKDTIWLLVSITTISMVITLHLQDGLVWLGSGTRLKVFKSDLSQNDDGKGAVPSMTSSNDDTLNPRTARNRPRNPNSGGSTEDKNVSPHSKNNHSMSGKSPEGNWDQSDTPREFQTSERRDANKEKSNYGSHDTILTRLSDKPDVNRDVQRTKLKGNDSSVQIPAFKTKILPGAKAELFQPVLYTSKVTAGRVSTSQVPGLGGHLGSSERDGGADRGQEGKAVLNSVEVERGNHSKKKATERQPRTKQDSSMDKERLSHSFRGGYKDSDTPSDQNIQTRITYTVRHARPRAQSTMGSYNSSVPFPNGQGSTATAENETEVTNLGGQDSPTPPLHVQALYDHIRQVEEAITDVPEGFPSVLVRGSVTSIKHHLPLIESAFHKYKAMVAFSAYDGYPDMSLKEVQSKSWSVVMCLNSTGKGDDCVVAAKGKLPPKVNIIGQIHAALFSPNLLCAGPKEQSQNTITDTGKTPSIRGEWCDGLLSCYPIPNRLRPVDATNQLQAPCDDTLWCQETDGVWLVPASNSTDKGRELGSLIPCINGRWQDPAVANSTIKLAPRGSVLVSLPKNLLSLDGQSPLVWQVKVLVTSLRPARVYIHPNGLVWQGLTSSISQRHKKALSLSELGQLFTELEQGKFSSFTLDDLKLGITRLINLLQTYPALLEDTSYIYKPKSFQLFNAVFVFNTSFHPFILEALPSTYQDSLSSLSEYLQEQNVLEDVAPMILASDRTTSKTHQVLLTLGFDTLKAGRLCSQQHDVCLEPDSIAFLLDMRREQMVSRNWRRVMPNIEEACWRHTSEVLLPRFNSQTSEEYIGMLAEMIATCPSNVQLNIPEATFLNPSVQAHDKQSRSKSKRESWDSTGARLFQEPLCSKDPVKLTHLKSIVTSPYLQLQPEFSALNVEYHLWADYNTTLIRLQVLTAHCRTRARIDELDLMESAGSANLTLGLGENIVLIKVEDEESVQPASLATYKLVIHRRDHRASVQSSFGRRGSHRGQLLACTLKQDCALRYIEDEGCGLMPWNKTNTGRRMTWQQFLAFHAKLPFCRSEYVKDATWLVPCSSCSDSSTCSWEDALWHQVMCQEERLSQSQLQHCFAGKQVLYIGDSTNRGIFNYITKRMNGSLLEWDKVHTMCDYPGLNQGRTVFGFAYYPQYWLEPSKPRFDVAFSKLRNRTMAVGGQWDTVLVIGGVHWLTKEHIKMLHASINRQGLKNVKIVVKGHGAGFHQSASQVHLNSLLDHQKIYLRNRKLMSYSTSRGLPTVDTFPMTMARFKDFRPGRCACHFHEVSVDQASVLSKLLPNRATKQVPPSQVQYNVHGEINAVYSEMVINRICRG